MLQKVLQLYASGVLSKRSYAKKGIIIILNFHVASLNIFLDTELLKRSLCP